MVNALLWEELCKALQSAGVEDARWDTDQLFYIALGRHYRSLDPDAQLPEETVQALRALAEKRSQRYPLQYLAGEWDFYNITLKLGPGVLIPRADTEIVTEQALRLLADLKAPRVLDLCAGTGAIGCAIAHNRPNAAVTAVELSPQALVYLRQNAAAYGVRVEAGDVRIEAAARPAASAELIVSNPPYVTAEEYAALAPELFFEPEMALVAPEEGLAFYRVIAREYRRVLCPGGWLCFEIGSGEGEAVCAILEQNGYTDISVVPDLSGLDRCVLARRADRPESITKRTVL